MERVFLGSGAILALLAVAAGAFGAHGLRGRLEPDMLEVFETAVRYQMYHALGLLAAGWVAYRFPGTAADLAGWTMLTGTVVFSGTLYILSLSGVRWWGAITPLGGVGMIAGWGFLAWAVWAAR